MSIQVMTLVWKGSLNKGSALLLLLAIADHAHDDGTGAWPSVETLAQQIRMTTRNTQRLLRLLEESGELVVGAGAGPNGVNTYTIPLTSFHPDKSVPLVSSSLTLPYNP